MVNVNVANSDTGKKLSPTYHVTALFLKAERLAVLVDDVEKVGFAKKDIEVFSGTEGAEELDYRGKHQGVIRRLLGDLAMMLSDESRLQSQVDRVLRNGGVFISINTDGEEKKKIAAFAILKDHQASEVCYWGPLAVERPEQSRSL